MNRIESIFGVLRAEGRKALMPFVTAGYPSLEATGAVLEQIDAAGASICEVGFPFSDPIADGPVISASMTDALGAGVTPGGVFEMVRERRERLSLGLVAMVSCSIVYRMGVSTFVEQARQAGFDGFIFPDLPLEEAGPVGDVVRDAGLSGSLLVAPTTPADRARRIAAACSGFVYIVARTGITGESEAAPVGLGERIAGLRQATDLPLAVGFGISAAEHVRAVVAQADAAIVGSALVRRITECRDQPAEQIGLSVGQFVRDLAAGLAG
jgi:tryptophan synthase alpha chain